MKLEQAFQMVKSISDNTMLNKADHILLDQALELIRKELFEKKVEKKKESKNGN